MQTSAKKTQTKRRSKNKKNEHGYCEKCNLDFDAGKIWDYFFEQYKSEDAADKVASLFGATREKGRFGKKIGLYCRDKDRTLFYKCPECGHIEERM
jgi:hypothetical protein